MSSNCCRSGMLGSPTSATCFTHLARHMGVYLLHTQHRLALRADFCAVFGSLCLGWSVLLLPPPPRFCAATTYSPSKTTIPTKRNLPQGSPSPSKPPSNSMQYLTITKMPGIE